MLNDSDSCSEGEDICDDESGSHDEECTPVLVMGNPVDGNVHDAGGVNKVVKTQQVAVEFGHQR